jgi:hypothetical protein
MSLKNITYLDLIEACQNPGCLVCSLSQDMVEGYIRMLFHEHINDPPSRDKLRESYGLCYHHIWLAIDSNLGNALGVAIISYDVIGEVLRDLEQINTEKDRLAKFRKLLNTTPNEVVLAPEKRCPVCLYKDVVEERILKTLIESIQKEKLSDAIQQSDGICLPHLRHLLMRNIPKDAAQALLGLSKERWEKLQEELSEFIRKNDYRFSKEGFGEERDSWLRVTAILTGNRPQ